MEEEDIVSENDKDIFDVADKRYEAIYNLIRENSVAFYEEHFKDAPVEEQRAALLKLHILGAETFVKLKISMFESLMAADITRLDSILDDE